MYWFEYINRIHTAQTLTRIRRIAYDVIEPEYPVIVIWDGDTKVGQVKLRHHPRSLVGWASAILWEEKGKKARVLDRDGTIRRVDRY